MTWTKQSASHIFRMKLWIGLKMVIRQIWYTWYITLAFWALSAMGTSTCTLTLITLCGQVLQWRQDKIERRPLPFFLSANKVIYDISLLLLCSWWQRKESRTQSRRRTSRFRIYRLSQAVSTLVLNVIYPTGRYFCWNLYFAIHLWQIH